MHATAFYQLLRVRLVLLGQELLKEEHYYTSRVILIVPSLKVSFTLARLRLSF